MFCEWMLHVGYEGTYHSYKKKKNSGEICIHSMHYSLSLVVWNGLSICYTLVLSRNKGKYWNLIHFFVDFLDVILVSEVALNLPVYDWWIKHLKLYRNDCDVLLDGTEQNASIISACQQLLLKKYPKIVGFEDTVLARPSPMVYY